MSAAGGVQGGGVTGRVASRCRFSLRWDVAEPIDLGDGDGVHRRIVPILGGRVEGPDLCGRVLPGGADFQILRSGTLTELEARYAIETDDGDRVYVENHGVRSGSADDIARIVAGEPVDPDRIYFRSNPRLSSSGMDRGMTGFRVWLMISL